MAEVCQALTWTLGPSFLCPSPRPLSPPQGPLQWPVWDRGGDCVGGGWAVGVKCTRTGQSSTL